MINDWKRKNIPKRPRNNHHIKTIKWLENVQVSVHNLAFLFSNEKETYNERAK